MAIRGSQNATRGLHAAPHNPHVGHTTLTGRFAVGAGGSHSRMQLPTCTYNLGTGNTARYLLGKPGQEGSTRPTYSNGKTGERECGQFALIPSPPASRFLMRPGNAGPQCKSLGGPRKPGNRPLLCRASGSAEGTWPLCVSSPVKWV